MTRALAREGKDEAGSLKAVALGETILLVVGDRAQAGTKESQT